MEERKGTLLRTAYEIAITDPVKKRPMSLSGTRTLLAALTETPVQDQNGEYQSEVEKAKAIGRLLAEVVKGITNNISSNNGVQIGSSTYINRHPYVPGDYGL